MIFVTAANNVYAEHLKVMLNSLLLNLSTYHEVAIYVLHSDLLIEEIINIDILARRFGASINFIKVEHEYINSIPHKASK